MDYRLEDINYRTVADPEGFIAECDEDYNKKVTAAAEKIAANLKSSPVVLLSGPSGSGKTTTAAKVSEALNKKGIFTHYVAMDDYFITVDPKVYPRNAEGELDFESPYCIDFDLLNDHFDMLARGEKIYVPTYSFTQHMRIPEPRKSIRLKKDEIVVFEGIHALNDLITDRHPEAFKLYISANSNVVFNGKIVFKSTWFRLVRRMVRDYNFRGSSADMTLAQWGNVRRGEKQNIRPFKHKADYAFDTSFAYELPAMNRVATELFQTIPEGIDRYDELKQVLPAIQLFGEIDQRLIPDDSMIREFIGGGIYA